MKKIIQKLLPKCAANLIETIEWNWLADYGFTSYSQEGEDMVLRRVFEDLTIGFYVDVGAHHPKRFSNTYYFYKKGWSGINIDAMPGSMALFKRVRPRDINLEIAVSDEKREMIYYIFNDPALNTFDPQRVQEVTTNMYSVIDKKTISTCTLGDILHEHLPSGQKIDFMSIDVEGVDYAVLRSNDWKAFRPECILVENIGARPDEIHNSDIFRFITEQGYVFFAKTIHTYIFLYEGAL